jgi:UDP-N-acetylglucosamine 3-dehydrogenase
VTVRLALLGTGLATRIHSTALKAVAPGVERWYASRDAQRAAAASARYGGAGHFPSYDAALAAPGIDAVVIALPPTLHLDWTLKALAAGKHVIVEKPPFLTSADFALADRHAAAAGRQVLVAENYVYKPLTRLLRRLITQGDLGDVQFIQVSALKRQITNDWRDEAPVAGGGALFEGGIHWISLLANIGLTPMTAHAVRVGPSRGLERSVLVTLTYAEGAAAALSYSWDQGGPINGVRWSRIYGTAATLRFETNGVLAVRLGRRPRVFVPGLSDLAGYRAMWLDFLAAIADNRAPVYASAARRDLRLVETACNSLTRPHD